MMSPKMSAVSNPLELYSKNQLGSISSNMWSRPATALLIELYRKVECLWKTNSTYYRNKKKRYDALQEMACAIAPFRPDTTVEDVKNKINGIRTQYVAEKNKVSFYAQKNPPTEYEPSLWCYDRLSFLSAYTSLKNKPTSDGNGFSKVSNEEVPNSENQQLQVKIEDDEIEFIESDDLNTSESAKGLDSSPQSIHYIEPSFKKAKLISDLEAQSPSNILQQVISIPYSKPEISLIRTPKSKATAGEFGSNETGSLFQKHEDPSYFENDEWIDVFGKFVSSQMKLITNKTLLIKLQHTIQSAIMNAQLKQIEFETVDI